MRFNNSKNALTNTYRIIFGFGIFDAFDFNFIIAHMLIYYYIYSIIAVRKRWIRVASAEGFCMYQL